MLIKHPRLHVHRPTPHALQEAANRDAEEKKQAAAAQPSPLDSGPPRQPHRETFPEVTDSDRIYQKNEGKCVVKDPGWKE